MVKDDTTPCPRMGSCCSMTTAVMSPMKERIAATSTHSRRRPRPTWTINRGVRIQLNAPVVMCNLATPPFRPGSTAAIHIGVLRAGSQQPDKAEGFAPAVQVENGRSAETAFPLGAKARGHAQAFVDVHLDKAKILATVRQREDQPLQALAVCSLSVRHMLPLALQFSANLRQNGRIHQECMESNL